MVHRNIFGHPEDAAWTGAGRGTVISVLKYMASLLGAAAGAVVDVSDRAGRVLGLARMQNGAGNDLQSTGGALHTREQTIAGATGDVHAPAANTAAVVTYNAVAGQRHVIYTCRWGYDAVPTGGSLQIEDGAGNIIDGPTPITADGAGEFTYHGKRGSTNTAMIVTLAAGGAAVSGVVSCDHETEAA